MKFKSLTCAAHFKQGQLVACAYDDKEYIHLLLVACIEQDCIHFENPLNGSMRYAVLDSGLFDHTFWWEIVPS